MRKRKAYLGRRCLRSLADDISRRVIETDIISGGTCMFSEEIVAFG